MNKRVPGRSIVVSLLVFTVTNAIARQPASDPGTIIEQFPVAGNGDALLLPVKIDKREYLFLVDTGASFTCFDRSLLADKPKERVAIESLVGMTSLELFDTPQATLGKIPLREVVPVVGGHDFDKFRKISGLAIYGVIGLDLLRKHVIQIDFDRGQFRFLKGSDPHMGKRVDLINEQGSVPAFHIDFPRIGKQRFELDTGLISQDSGELSATLCRRLIEDGICRDVGHSLVESVSGTTRQTLVQSKELALGEVAVKNPILSAGKSNLLGLGYLSRFNVTIDFPRQRMYLKENKAINRCDARDLSGMRLIRNNARTEVESVVSDSPTAKAGLRSGDVLVRIQGKETEKMSLFDLRRWLCDEGGSLRLVARRDGKEFEIELHLKK